MRAKICRRLLRDVVSLIVGSALVAVCSHAADVAPADRRGASPPAPREVPGNSSKESTKSPSQPAPAESRTPEEAAKRAADPTDPSGALIVQPPRGR